MANTYTNINAEIIVQEVFPAFKAGLAPVNAFSVSFDSETAQKGASIRVPVISAKTANTGAFTTYEDGNSTVAGTQVSLSTHVRSFSHVTDTEAGKTPANTVIAQRREDAYAVGKSIFQTVIGLFLAADYGDVEGTSKLTVTAANYDADNLADAVTYLKKRDALGDISAIHDLDYMGALLKDNAVQNASALGSAEAIREGAISNLVGANIYNSNGFPSALTAENTGVVVCVPSAIALAIRPIAPQDGAMEAGLEYATATDPDTGLTLGFRSFYNTATGEKWAGFEALMGADTLQAAGAVRIVSE